MIRCRREGAGLADTNARQNKKKCASCEYEYVLLVIPGYIPVVHALQEFCKAFFRKLTRIHAPLYGV